MTDPEGDQAERRSPVLGAAVRVTAILTAAGSIGQVFTLVRELFVASQVGVSVDLDALLVAAVAPTIIASVISSGTAAAIVPGYAATTVEHGKASADRLLGAILTWTIITSLTAMAVIILGAHVFVTIAGPGLGERGRDLALGFVPVLAPMVVFMAAASIMAATFQIHERMRMIGSAWLLGPLASVVVTLGLWPALGLTALAVGMVAQQAVVFGVLVVLAIRIGILPRPSLRADPDQAVRFVKHALPLAVSSSILSLNLLADRAIATLIVPGGASALRYAEGVIRIPMNAILPAWTAAIYPALVRASYLERAGSLGAAAGGALRYLTIIFVPLSVATAALAPLIVNVAYGRGAFDEQASLLTSGALAGLAPLLFLTMANSILTGSHNARRRGLFLMSMGILNAVLNALFNVGLGLLLGVAGIALSTSLTVGLVQFIKAWRLGTLDEGFPLGDLLQVGARSLVASAIVAVPIAVVAWTLPVAQDLPVALGLLVALTAAGMVGYVAIGRIIGLREPWDVARLLLTAPVRGIRGRS